MSAQLSLLPTLRKYPDSRQMPLAMQPTPWPKSLPSDTHTLKLGPMGSLAWTFEIGLKEGYSVSLSPRETWDDRCSESRESVMEMDGNRFVDRCRGGQMWPRGARGWGHTQLREGGAWGRQGGGERGPDSVVFPPSCLFVLVSM